MDTKDNEPTGKNLILSKREEYLLKSRNKRNHEILKQKREDRMQKLNQQKEDIKESTDQQIERNSKSLIEACNSKNVDSILTALGAIRNVLAFPDDPPVQKVVDQGIIPYVADLVRKGNVVNEKLLQEALWILANIASDDDSEFCKEILRQNISEDLVFLMQYPDEEVKNCVLFVLANLTGDSLTIRDHFLDLGIMDKIVQSMQNTTQEKKFMIQISWLIQNLCRGVPYPPFKKTKPILPFLKFLINTYADEEVEITTKVIYTIQYLTQGDENQIQQILNLSILPQIMKVASNNNHQGQHPAIIIILNISSESDSQCDELFKYGILDQLSSLINHEDKLIRKDVVGTISNLIACSPDQIKLLFNYGNNHFFIQKVIEFAIQEEYPIAKEAIITLRNVSETGTMSQLDILIDDFDLFDIFASILKSERTEVAEMVAVLKGLNSIFNQVQQVYGYKYEENPYIDRLIVSECLNLIESLQTHKSDEVYLEVDKFIDDHLQTVWDQ